jgi:DNA invertase Pin-like site-specific DNA recombinase
MPKKQKVIGYVRVSDARKASSDAQRAAILCYVDRNNLELDSIVEEHISATTTNLEDRQLMTLINSNANIVVSDITRIGRNEILDLISAIAQIAKHGSLHLAYDDRVINAANRSETETVFTIIGQSFASAAEAQKRSDRAKAGNASRKAKGLSVGRKVGQVVKSKLDDHVGFILSHKAKGTSVVKLLALLDSERNVSVSSAGYYKWLKTREGLINAKTQLELVG